MKSIWSAALISTVLIAQPAAAQDLSGFAGLLATATEGYAQAFGEAVVNGQSVFVTAHGKAKLPAPLTGSYFVNVDGKAVSAVVAAQQRESKLSQLRTVAQKFGVEMEVGESKFTLEVDTAAQQRRNREMAAERAAHPATLTAPVVIIPPIGEAPKVFVARTGVRFKEPPAARLAEFLDAIKAAGVDDIRTSATAPTIGFIPQSSEVLGFGSVEAINDKIWNAASADAVNNARDQAQALAMPAGRTVGEARQILMLSKSIQGSEAVVTVAVRFGFAPKP